VIVSGLLDINLARTMVPDDLPIVEVRPGRSAAAIIVADYQSRATFPYSELAVMPAMVRYRGVRGPWISHIWVNSQASLEGGRRMWGLAKEHADFSWDGGPTRRVQVSAAGTPLGTLSWTAPARRFPFPGRVTGVGSVDGDRRSYRALGVAWLGRTDVDLAVPPGSPLAPVAAGLQRRKTMAGDLNWRFGNITILAPPADDAIFLG
jgi:hypothetical protein